MLASKILIPVDGSPASLRALDYAIKMATKSGQFICLLNVQNVSATELSGEFMHGVQDRLLQAAGKALKEATAKCGAANIPFEDLVRTGPIAETIAQVARDTGVDHIVMGTRGLGRISRHAFGLGRHEGHPPSRSFDYPTQVAVQNPTVDLTMPRHFPPPWTVEQIPGGYKVLDANDQSLGHVYCRESKADAETDHG